jgi:predicted DNA-binding protein YlxM (UPF0122 family)
MNQVSSVFALHRLAGGDASMEKRVETAWLLDFYGPLLTERQRSLLHMYCEQDLSLAEIAEREGISRQAVHGAVRRGEQQLRAYERQLGLLGRHRRLIDGLRRCGAELAKPEPALREARDALADLLAEEEG